MTTEPKKIKPVHAALGVFTILFIAGIALTVKNRSLAQDFEKGNTISNVLSLNERMRYYRRHFPEAEIVVNRELKDKDMMKVTLTEISLFEEETGEDFSFFGSRFLSDKSNNLYLTNPRGSIRKFDTKGRLIKTIGRAGQGPGEFAPGPLASFFSITEDTLLTVNRGNRRLSFFTPDGKYLDSKQIEHIETALPAAPTLLGNDKFVISYWDEKQDNVLHIYDFEGKRIHSFGVSMLFTGNMHYAERTNKRNFSNGRIVVYDDLMYFSQRNPYGIQVYTKDGILKKVIFRENDFMPSAWVLRKGEQGVFFPSPPNVIYFGIYQDMLVNFIWVPEYVNHELGGVMDFFTLDGRLISTVKFEMETGLHLIDSQGTFWIEERNEWGESFLKRYKIEIEENPA